jgi:hypothetical protein
MQMQLQSILVVGTGRCGTSTVARVLHEQLGVCMGSRFREADANNPRGFYEDLDALEANQRLLAGGSLRDELLIRPCLTEGRPNG